MPASLYANEVGATRAIRDSGFGLLVGVLSIVLACSDDAAHPAMQARAPMTLEQAKSPASCKSCHPLAYGEWASSMHAYASKDPVFVAMNQRGQRETGGRLGNFCLKCHAPMAVLDGTIDDPSASLTGLPDAYQGVTCYTCHNAMNVIGDHNAVLELSQDVTLRGPIKDASVKQPIVHRAAYSPYFDDGRAESNQLCGGCHDIVNANAVHIERTYEEYKQSFYSRNDPLLGGGMSCSGCHMDSHVGLAAVDPSSGVGERAVHDHIWAGVDVALTDFPDRDAQRRAVECALKSGVRTFNFIPNSACGPNATHNAFCVTLEGQAGHRVPSGAAQDRRMWLEMLAYDSNGALLADESSGAIEDGAIEEPPDVKTRDPSLWMMHDTMFDVNGDPTHDFWNAAPSAAHPSGHQDDPASTLPVQSDSMAPHYLSRAYRYRALGDGPGQVSRVVSRLRMRPIGQDVLADLVASGDLDRSIRSNMPTFTLAGTSIEWKYGVEYGIDGVPLQPDDLGCANSYRCQYEGTICKAAAGDD